MARTRARTSPVLLFRLHVVSSERVHGHSKVHATFDAFLLALAMSLLGVGSRRVLLSRCTHSCSRSSAVSRYYSQATTGEATPEECDVVIVGGGPAGLALSSALGMSYHGTAMM